MTRERVFIYWFVYLPMRRYLENAYDGGAPVPIFLIYEQYCWDTRSASGQAWVWVDAVFIKYGSVGSEKGVDGGGVLGTHAKEMDGI